MIEYGLLAAFISIVAVLALQKLGPEVKDFFESVAAAIPGGGGGKCCD